MITALRVANRPARRCSVRDPCIDSGCLCLPADRATRAAAVHGSRVTTVQMTSSREVTPPMHRSDDTDARSEARRCFG